MGDKAVMPPLPTSLGAGGSEVWDWAARFSDAVQARAKIAELHSQIAKRECGDCRLWMTQSCPREVHDNLLGRSRGPSCIGIRVMGVIDQLRESTTNAGDGNG